MTIPWMLALLAATALAQAPPNPVAPDDTGVSTSAQELADKMLASSVAIFGMVKENGGQLSVATQGAGFFLNSQTVVTSASVCCTRFKGQMPQPRIVYGTQSEFAKVLWTSAEDGIALLQLEQPLGAADADVGVNVVPSKFEHAGQPVFTVQFSGPGDATPPQVDTGELEDLAPVEGFENSVFKTSAPMDAFNSGGALFDACGNAIGVNWRSSDGSQYAFTLDALLAQLDEAGLTDKVADAPCEDKPGTNASASSWHLPPGSQWIAVGVMVCMLAGVGLWLGKRSTITPPKNKNDGI